jgi:hypothetical protein
MPITHHRGLLPPSTITHHSSPPPAEHMSLTNCPNNNTVHLNHACHTQPSHTSITSSAFTTSPCPCTHHHDHALVTDHPMICARASIILDPLSINIHHQLTHARTPGHACDFLNPPHSPNVRLECHLHPSHVCQPHVSFTAKHSSCTCYLPR